ncbi:MAG: agmatinase [Rhodospirillales bacterium]|jgi:guanidinopropionase|nr:agmatinase [Rhodospirillales bacterium]
MIKNNDGGQLNQTSWWGVATFFRCSLEDDLSETDIALIGVPHSSGNGTTERDQHLGPRAVRNVSGEYRRFHKEFKISPWDACRISDVGDVSLPHAMNNDVTIKDIEAWYHDIDTAGVCPVSIGGDHSITLPILRALAGPQSKTTNEPLAVLHFDAHHDSYGVEDVGAKHFLGNYEWAGAWGKIMGDEGLVNPEKVIQIGMRGHGYTENDGIESHRLGYRVIDKDEFDEMGTDAVVAEIRERIGDTPLYITFDMDVLDTTVAPGVSNLEPGYPGMTMIEAMRVLQGLRGLNVIGADVVCLMPTKDNPNNITSINASIIMFEQISLIADRLGANQ